MDEITRLIVCPHCGYAENLNIYPYCKRCAGPLPGAAAEHARTMPRPDELDQAWRAASSATWRLRPGSGFGVEADGPGYRAWSGHEEHHAGRIEAWSISDPELTDDPDDPATPAKALLRLVHMMENPVAVTTADDPATGDGNTPPGDES